MSSILLAAARRPGVVVGAAALAIAAAGCVDGRDRCAAGGGALVQGRVLDGTDQAPLAGALISTRVGECARQTSSSGAGEFVLDGLPAATTLDVDVVAAGYAPARYRVRTGARSADGAAVTLLDALQFPSDNTVRVSVRMPNGAAVSGATLLAFADPAAGYRLTDVPRGISGADGWATLVGIATWHDYTLRTPPITVQEQVLVGNARYRHRYGDDEATVVLGPDPGPAGRPPVREPDGGAGPGGDCDATCEEYASFCAVADLRCEACDCILTSVGCDGVAACLEQ